MGEDPLERSSMECIPTVGPDPISEQMALILQPTNQPTYYILSMIRKSDFLLSKLLLVQTLTKFHYSSIGLKQLTFISYKISFTLTLNVNKRFDATILTLKKKFKESKTKLHVKSQIVNINVVKPTRQQIVIP